MDLTKELMNNFVDECRLAGIEIIGEKNIFDLLEKKEVIRIYAGFESTGVLHIGGLCTLFLLKFFTKFSNCKVFGLISNAHAALNVGVDRSEIQLKELSNQIKQLLGAESTMVYALTPEDNSVPDWTTNCGLYSQKRYLQNLVSTSNFVNMNDAFRASTELIKTNSLKTSLLVSQALYSIMQVNDIKTLEIAISIGGTDQRKIHMLAHDTVCPSVCYLQTPLITAGGVKISKSKSARAFDSLQGLEDLIAKLSKTEALLFVRLLFFGEESDELMVSKIELINSIENESYNIWSKILLRAASKKIESLSVNSE